MLFSPLGEEKKKKFSAIFFYPEKFFKKQGGPEIRPMKYPCTEDTPANVTYASNGTLPL